MKDRETLAYAIAVYGREAQITKAVEELAELSVELLHYQERGGSVDAVREEIADVSVMIDQLALIFGGTEAFRRRKIERLRERLGLS